MKRNYIGLSISPYYAAIAIINADGEVVFAEAAERHLQNKRAWMAAPDDFMRILSLIKEYCEPNLDLTISTSYSSGLIAQPQDTLAAQPDTDTHTQSNIQNHIPSDRSHQPVHNHHGASTEFHYKNQFPQANIVRKNYDPHLAHAAQGCYTSPFKQAVCVVMDGEGSDASNSCYLFANNKINKVPSARSSGSLGEFYKLLCTLCWLNHFAEEQWRVMALAAYGKLNPQYYALLKSLFIVDDISIHTSPHYHDTVTELTLMQKNSDENKSDLADLAHTGQKVFTEIMDAYLFNLHAKNISDNLILCGSGMLNASYTGSVHTNTPFKHVYIPSAPGDDGNAIGAAFLAFYDDHPHHKRSIKTQTPYLGSAMDITKIEYLKKFGKLSSQHFKDDNQLCQFIAKKISEGNIVGWVQGRAEFGPRALGNRSILADPRSPNIKDKLNSCVKFREPYRPYAPSILAEHANQYFENYVYTPYMERVLFFKEEVKKKIPGVVHADGTGRLQSVDQSLNKKYALLLNSFYELTAIPMLLNTSFNVMGKPMIHSIEDAISVFYTSNIDLLVIDNHVFEKDSAQQ